jgi:hypothetical protein
MSMIVKDGGDFENHPEGQVRAVCMDVVDLGMVENKRFGKMQHKIALVFHTEAKMKDGRPFEIWERFTATLTSNGYLRPFLESWRGKAFNPSELDGFDVEKLIGANAYIQVIHNRVGDKVYANIKSVMMLPKGLEKVAPTPGYERRKDRKTEQAPVAVAAGNFEEPPPALDDDDDLPF